MIVFLAWKQSGLMRLTAGVSRTLARAQMSVVGPTGERELSSGVK